MSDEQEEALPTVVIVNIDAESGYSFADITDYGCHLRRGDELVRRKDVKALIQDKIEKYDRPTTDPYVQQSILDKLEELLDEVQNSQ